MAEKQKLCVTGAGGYVASWLVKLLLSKGHTVHGTVRNPGDAKYAHLHNLDKAPHNLKLFKADLLDYDSLAAAITGCTGVFHVACPKDLVEPALNGTLNVLKACSESNVKRVVIVSSVSAVFVTPNWPKDKHTVNASSLVLVKLLKEGYETLENKGRLLVDVRDVVESLLLVYERPEAEGRYICTAHEIKSQDLVEMLKKMYPNYSYPKSFTAREGDDEKLSSERLQRLGWTYRPLEETLNDSIESYRQAGILD
nr:cinnamoyl-coa reductase 2 [Ipomoea batatas]